MFRIPVDGELSELQVLDLIERLAAEFRTPAPIMEAAVRGLWDTLRRYAAPAEFESALARIPDARALLETLRPSDDESAVPTRELTMPTALTRAGLPTEHHARFLAANFEFIRDRLGLSAAFRILSSVPNITEAFPDTER